MLNRSITAIVASCFLAVVTSFSTLLFAGCGDAAANQKTAPSVVGIIKVKTDKGCVTAYDAKFALKPPAAAANDDVDRPNQCKVFDIVDGDTFTCDFNHDGIITRKTEKVRMLYIDTPELHHSKRNPTGEPQPFSKEAAAYTKNQLLGKTVFLRYDKKPEDRYGRKLALVYTANPAKTNSFSINELLVLEGLAQVMIVKPNETYQPQMKALEEQALQARKGLWSAPIEF
jgi:endonuclease YncB( thermonuclease family)